MNTFILSFLFVLGAVPGLGLNQDWLVADSSPKPRSWFSSSKPEEPPPPPELPEYPFDREHIEPLCKYLFYGGEPNTRYFSHGFTLKYTSGLHSIQCVGKDQLLGVEVHLYFDDHQRTRLSRCIAHHEEHSYMATNIFQVSLSPKKRVFMISFKECDTILLVYVSKEHPAWGFWTLPTESLPTE